MDPAPALTSSTVAVVAVVALVSVLLVALVAVRSRRSRRRLEAELDVARADLAALRVRVEQPSGPPRREDGQPPCEDPTDREYLITSMPAAPGTRLVRVEDAAPVLPAGRFATVAATETVVRAVAVAHGVRRALSAESRNRIRFEMRREVKRSRRRRRHDLKQARRQLRARSTADLSGDAA